MHLHWISSITTARNSLEWDRESWQLRKYKMVVDNSVTILCLCVKRRLRGERTNEVRWTFHCCKFGNYIISQHFSISCTFYRPSVVTSSKKVKSGDKGACKYRSTQSLYLRVTVMQSDRDYWLLSSRGSSNLHCQSKRNGPRMSPEVLAYHPLATSGTPELIRKHVEKQVQNLVNCRTPVTAEYVKYLGHLQEELRLSSSCNKLCRNGNSLKPRSVACATNFFKFAYNFYSTHGPRRSHGFCEHATSLRHLCIQMIYFTISASSLLVSGMLFRVQESKMSSTHFTVPFLSLREKTLMMISIAYDDQRMSSAYDDVKRWTRKSAYFGNFFSFRERFSRLGSESKTQCEMLRL